MSEVSELPSLTYSPEARQGVSDLSASSAAVQKGQAKAVLLLGLARSKAVSLICQNHYTRSVPSGKSHYVGYGDAVVVWSIPANKNIGRFLLGIGDWEVWELSRLWAPDGHDDNLLTRAISKAVGMLRLLESPDVLVSYADPAIGHHGGVYRAASWLFHGVAAETRMYVNSDGKRVARRAFHSGNNSMSKSQIEGMGWKQTKDPGKFRYVKPISRHAVRWIAAQLEGRK